MSATLLIIDLVIVFVMTLFLLNKYISWRKQHFVVTISTFVGWYFSFVIIFVLPLDIAITFYNRCVIEQEHLVIREMVNNTENFCVQPDGFVPNNLLLRMWRFVYWTAQLLTWIVLPHMQSYSNAGDFSVLGKLRSAAYNNIIYYGAYSVVFLVIMVYAAAKGVVLNAEHLKVILISASNTWGLFLLVILLGYGLVEVPRQIWQMGSKDYRLKKTYFDIEKLSVDKSDAEDALKEVYKEARSVLTLLHNKPVIRDYAQIIVGKFSSEVVSEIISSNSSGNFSAASNISPRDERMVENEKFLIKLHKRVIKCVQNHHRTQAQWQALIHKALYLEDIHQAELTGKFVRYKKEKKGYLRCPNQLQYIWHIVLKRKLLKVVGSIFFMMTVFIMWSECTFFIIHPRLSSAAQIVHLAANGYHYFYIQICATVIISYLCICAYYTVFKLRIYRYYHLDPHHMTDENSLIFSAMLLCRLTPPICLNVLGMIHLDSHITSEKNYGAETQFTKLMGHLDVIPILADGINIYLPILIVVLCLGTWFRIGSRFLHALGIDQFVEEDDMTHESIQSGKALVSLERNKIVRAVDREERNIYWAEKLIDNTVAGKNLSNAREYSDREPIISAVDDDEFKSFTDFSNTSNFHTPSAHPPSNLFDDL